MSDIIVGIDLGTTNSAVAVVQDGQPRLLGRGDEKIIPSVVGYSKTGGWLVGRPALNQYTLDPENTIRSIKRKMGTDETVQLGSRQFTPQQISAFILRELKTIAEESLGQPVSKAVITVPAYFTNAQRQVTQEAGKIAGLEVVRIINEPTAAALAYGLNQEADYMALVYDLGGGTFDVSLVEMTDGIVEVRASHGDTQLGGDDFDATLAEHAGKLFYKKHQISLKDNRLAMARLTQAAETAKIHLSSFTEANLREEYLVEQNNLPLHLDDKVLRSEFEEMVEALLDRTIESLEQVLTDAEVGPEEVDRVLLVGGATRMPMVWSLVANYTGLEPDAEINPDEAVALGAAVQAAIIAGEPIEAILVDVTPYSLGIETAVQIGPQVVPDIYNVLIHRNTAIPTTKEQIYKTLHPDQDTVQVKVYQGELPIASANTLLGDFLIEGLQAETPHKCATVTVRFDFDVNGMLHVQATDRFTKQQASISVQATQARLTPQDIAQARADLADMVDEFLADELEGAGEMVLEEETEITIDEETQALLDRGQKLLEGETLSQEQATALTDLIQAIKRVRSQDTLDEYAADLLDMLFDLD